MSAPSRRISGRKSGKLVAIGPPSSTVIGASLTRPRTRKHERMPVASRASVSQDSYDARDYQSAGVALESIETDESYDSIDHDQPISPTRRGRVRAHTPESRRRRRKRRTVLAAVIAIMLIAVVGVGYYGLRAAGMLDSRKDYTNAAGAGDVVVDIPDNSTLADFGRILVDADVRRFMAGVRAAGF